MDYAWISVAGTDEWNTVQWFTEARACEHQRLGQMCHGCLGVWLEWADVAVPDISGPRWDQRARVTEVAI